MLRTRCPHCNVSISYTPEMAAKSGRCPSCKGRVTLPVTKEEDQLWYTEALVQAPPLVTQVPTPPIAKVVPPVAKVAKVVQDDDVQYAEDAESPPRRKKKSRPWYSVRVGNIVGGLGLLILVLIILVWLNRNAAPSKATVEAEAIRMMNLKGVSVTSVDLVEESKNQYVGIAKGTDGEQYRVHVTCDGEKILVEWRPIWP